MVGHAWLWCQSERMGSLLFLLNVCTRIDKPEMVIKAIKSQFMSIVALTCETKTAVVFEPRVAYAWFLAQMISSRLYLFRKSILARFEPQEEIMTTLSIHFFENVQKIASFKGSPMSNNGRKCMVMVSK